MDVPTILLAQLSECTPEQLLRARGLAERGVGAIARFCAKALTPPKPLALANALDKLQRIGALRQRDEELTPLGKPQGLKTTSLRSYSALTCTRRYIPGGYSGRQEIVFRNHGHRDVLHM